MKQKLLLPVLLLFTMSAVAEEDGAVNLWQLLTAAPDQVAEVTVHLPTDALPDTISVVEVPGVGPVSFSAGENGQLRLFLAPSDSAVSFSSVRVTGSSGDVTEVATEPVEVHWLDLTATAGLRVTSALWTDRALLLQLTNDSAADLVITGFTYAPAVISTGLLLVASESAPFDELMQVELPVDSLTGKYVIRADAGADYREFSFATGELPLAAGDQLLLVLGGGGFTDPALYRTGSVPLFAPWLEYRQDGWTFSLVPLTLSRGQ